MRMTGVTHTRQATTHRARERVCVRVCGVLRVRLMLLLMLLLVAAAAAWLCV